ncbi:MAG: alpha/beta hydrolase [Candidatus Promineifilaceae bacterium]
MNCLAYRKATAKRAGLLFLLAFLLVACQDDTATPEASGQSNTLSSVTPEKVSPEHPAVEPLAIKSEPSATVSTSFEPRFEPAVCQSDVPQGREVECGYLSVPEKYSQPGNGRTLRLHVAVFKSDNANPAPDPIVYLAGGPGADVLEVVQFEFETAFAPLLADRDLILFDQRGTGYSEPSLACPELSDATYEMLALELSFEEVAARNADALFECRDRLVGEGVDLSAYNSAESASDVNALRLALGYDEWNLYGTSYGTRLAQTVMRDHPEGIRSVVLDSVYPIAANMHTDTPANVSRAMDLFFSTCEADPVCEEVYPNLKGTFFALVDQLNREPISVSIPNVLTGERHDAKIDGVGILVLLFQSLYQAELTSLFPKMIDDVQQGDYDLLTGYLANWLIKLELFSAGMQLSVQCHEEAVFADPEDVAESVAAYPDLSELFTYSTSTGEMALRICAQWGSGRADPRENQAITSDLPTLIITGENDPVTPPSWARQVAQGLSNHFLYAFPGVGHGPSFSDDCPRSVALQYLNDPTNEPDTSCLVDMSFSFVMPFMAEQVTFEPVVIEPFNISALAPSGWIRVNDEYFIAPDRSIELVIRENREQPIDAFRTIWGAGEVFDEIDAEGLTWSISEVSLEENAVTGMAATAPSEDGFYVVMMVTTPDQQASLYELVLLPIINSFIVDLVATP